MYNLPNNYINYLPLLNKKTATIALARVLENIFLQRNGHNIGIINSLIVQDMLKKVQETSSHLLPLPSITFNLHILIRLCFVFLQILIALMLN